MKEFRTFWAVCLVGMALAWACRDAGAQGPASGRAADAPAAAATATVPADRPADAASQPAGDAEKYRILVDKVLTAGHGGAVTDEVLRQVAEAGFNVFGSRLGSEDEAPLRLAAATARKHGLKYLAWMRGTRSTRGNEGYVMQAGQVINICRPDSDELWDWLTRTILMQARVSKDEPGLLGVFLDFEVYSKLAFSCAYAPSYDEKTLQAFARAQGREIPALPPEQRHRWMAEQKLLEAYEQFQVDSWRLRCRELRKQVSAINPKFRFFLYPGPISVFLVRAAGPEWSTPAAPALFADIETYGRPAWISRVPARPQASDLLANRAALLRDLDVLKKAGSPYRYVGGIDPAVQGADPEFSARNAVMEAETTDGYWVFYEGPNYDKPDHAEYWRWFALANQAIQQGRYEFWKEPRQTQDLYDGDKIAPKTSRTQVGVCGLDAEAVQALEETGRYEVHPIRDTAPQYLQPLAVVVLQDFSYAPWHAKKAATDLPQYLAAGGRVLLAHDTAVLVGKAAPEVAAIVRAKEKADRYGRLTGGKLAVADGQPLSLGMKAGEPLPTTCGTSWTFQPGKAGKVVLQAEGGAAACVAGSAGTGKAVFYGGSFSKGMNASEKKLLVAAINWLAEK